MCATGFVFVCFLCLWFGLVFCFWLCFGLWWRLVSSWKGWFRLLCDSARFFLDLRFKKGVGLFFRLSFSRAEVMGVFFRWQRQKLKSL